MADFLRASINLRKISNKIVKEAEKVAKDLESRSLSLEFDKKLTKKMSK